MWYEGDNNVRAYAYNGEELVPEEKGILEVRDQFATMLSGYDKVAAVMTGDEHGYSRVLVDSDVPVGDITKDDKNGDGVISEEEGYSTLSSLENPVWYISAGGAGAPFYAEEFTPWQEYWNEQDDPLIGFKYSSQEHTVVFDVTDEGIAMEAYSIYGEPIDRIDNLMDVKDVEPEPELVTVGDFSITFDAERIDDDASGLLVTDNVDLDIPLFEISNPDKLTLGSEGLLLDEADLLLAPEFAKALNIEDAAGADVGDIRLHADFSLEDLNLEIGTGVTSVSLDTELLEEVAGLKLVGTKDTVEPAEGFDVGFAIIDKTDFSVGLDGVSGAIEHSGQVTFEV